MQKILISGCLYGDNVRYDAGNCLIDQDLFDQWHSEGRLVPICPEVAGGLSVPRAPCEQFDGRVIDAEGLDYTEEFHAGAQLALDLAKRENVRFALLKEQSPSCGVNIIYDGTFSSHKIPGSGVTASLLKAHGIETYSERQIEALIERLEQEK